MAMDKCNVWMWLNECMYVCYKIWKINKKSGILPPNLLYKYCQILQNSIFSRSCGHPPQILPTTLLESLVQSSDWSLRAVLVKRGGVEAGSAGPQILPTPLLASLVPKEQWLVITRCISVALRGVGRIYGPILPTPLLASLVPTGQWLFIMHCTSYVKREEGRIYRPILSTPRLASLVPTEQWLGITRCTSETRRGVGRIYGPIVLFIYYCSTKRKIGVELSLGTFHSPRQVLCAESTRRGAAWRARDPRTCGGSDTALLPKIHQI
jgi:hypothetical protein